MPYIKTEYTKPDPKRLILTNKRKIIDNKMITNLSGNDRSPSMGRRHEEA